MTDKLKPLFRRDILAFARKTILELSGTKLSHDPYLEYVATKLADFADGNIKRLLVNIPPRHGKSLMFSVSLSAWEFAQRPSAKIMVVAYSEQLAETIARGTRNTLQADWFKEIFPTRIAQDHSAVMDFSTTAGGALYAVPFGGGITGRGADLIIVDDPHDIKDAGSVQALERTIELFETILMSRLNNRKTGRVIVIGHRVHEKDLSGHLLRQGDWHHIALPMVATSDATYATHYGDWHRQKFDLLRPDAFSWEDVEQLKVNTHNPDFELLYQQDADSSALPPITPDCFPSFAGAPGFELPIVVSVDPGVTPGRRNSFSVAQIWCSVGDNHYLLDQWRQQCEFSELDLRVRKYLRFMRPSAILIERTANGYSLISTMKRHEKLIHEITPGGSKSARLRRHIETVLGRKLHLQAKAPWRDEFVEEFVKFPRGNFTDQVDAATQYLDFIAKNQNLPKPPRMVIGVNARKMSRRR